jgi:large subunit ribosomal protein L5
MSSLKEKYKKEVISKMKEKFGYKNDLAIPRIKKTVVNVGFGRQMVAKTSDEKKKVYKSILEDLTLITGQRLVLRNAKKSIAGFKIREGMPIGGAATLRGRKMYDFLERLIYIALPRSRDFKGIDPKSVDEEGNLTVGIKEHIIFPEVSPERAKQIFGFEITVVTTAKSKEEGLKLLKLLGFPIKS